MRLFRFPHLSARGFWTTLALADAVAALAAAILGAWRPRAAWILLACAVAVSLLAATAYVVQWRRRGGVGEPLRGS